MPANTMQERISSLIINLAEIKNPENFQIITPDTQKETCGLTPDLSKEEGQRFIEEIINDKQIGVLVIDNLSTLFRSGRENESESWNPIAQWVLKLRTQGKSIIFVHHAGKNDNQRGTSKKEDILDTVIKLKRPEDYESNEGSRFEVHFEKSRGFAGESANPFEVKLELTENKAIWKIKEIEDIQEKEVLELNKEGSSQRKIAKELNISASKVNRILNRTKEKKR
jgi:putative DNA primase/helicase